MTELKEAAREHSKRYSSETYKDGSCTVIPSYTARNSFEFGAAWQAKQSPWISVEERLPEDGDDLYIVLDTTMNPIGVGLCDFDVQSKKWVDNYHLVVKPTHWMYIPEV